MQSAKDPALSHLLPALRRLHEPWISDFFNPTTTQHLSQLRQALNNQTLTGTLHLSPYSTTTHNCSPNLTFIFAPSFSTGTTTVGFDLTYRPEASLPLDIPHRSVSRAVRDDVTGMFLSVTRTPQHTEIALSRITPNGRSISLTSLTNTCYDKLLENSVSMVSGMCEDVFDSGVISTLYGEDHLSPSPCAKLHPMDFAAEQRNVECFVDEFHSVAQINQYNNGRLMNTDWCFASMQMDITRGGVVLNDMRDWAIQQAVKACRIRLPGLCVPASGFQIEDDANIDHTDMAIVPRTAKSTDFSPDDIVKILAELDTTTEHPLFDGNAFALLSGDDENDASFLKDCPQDIDLCQDVTLSKSSVTSAITVTPPQTTISYVHTTNPTNARKLSLPQSSGNPIVRNDLPEVTSNQSPDDAYVIEHILPRRAVTIAPADVSNAERTVMTESQRKEERRKARNRASALRSNEKKRLHLKKLKEDIAATGKREVVLREKERLLREKNWQLRIALRQSDLGQRH